MTVFPEHPIIRNLEQTGTTDGKDEEYPICPECGEECEKIYKTQNGTIIGCDNCISESDAWETPQCFPEKD